MNILIVDDSMICRNIMKKLLKNNDDIDLIFFADNGLDAIKQITLNKDEINFVLIDNEMPILNGAHTVRHLREIHYDKLIFGITSSSGNLIKDFENCGIDYLFSKPFNENKMNIMMEFTQKYGFNRMKNRKIVMNETGKLNWVSQE